MYDDDFRLRNVPKMSQRMFQNNVDNAVDTEEFATEKWDNILVEHYIPIQTQVIIPGWKTRSIKQILKAKKLIPIQLNTKINFKVNWRDKDGTKTTWFWKVRNVGSTAIAKNCIRGQIIQSNDNISETAHFPGPHFVEVYGVRENRVYLFGRVNVPL